MNLKHLLSRNLHNVYRTHSDILYRPYITLIHIYMIRNTHIFNGKSCKASFAFACKNIRTQTEKH